MSDLVADMQAKVAELVAQAKEPLVRCVAELEAELAEMKARHCETCDHADKNGSPWGCRADMLLFPKPAECCNRWTARAAEGA